MAIDPVCRMKTGEDTAVEKTEYKGRVYFFCRSRYDDRDDTLGRYYGEEKGNRKICNRRTSYRSSCCSR
ncbi:MAG: YHS domain-containing protein [Deltaproteobacteria bacterium]|nr:YHS domain-containing protein [Deltaproteobacteria bacterium]